MEKKEMVYIASVAIEKNMDYETLLYSDYLYGNEKYIDDVWEYVEEAKENGMKSFREKYSEYELY